MHRDMALNLRRRLVIGLERIIALDKRKRIAIHAVELASNYHTKTQFGTSFQRSDHLAGCDRS